MPNEARYLAVDGSLSGTGVRDAVEGGYLTPSVIGVSDGLAMKSQPGLSDMNWLIFGHIQIQLKLIN